MSFGHHADETAADIPRAFLDFDDIEHYFPDVFAEADAFDVLDFVDDESWPEPSEADRLWLAEDNARETAAERREMLAWCEAGAAILETRGATP